MLCCAEPSRKGIKQNYVMILGEHHSAPRFPTPLFIAVTTVTILLKTEPLNLLHSTGVNKRYFPFFLTCFARGAWDC